MKTAIGYLPAFLVFCTFSVYSQTNPPSGAPHSMRLCVDECATLTWAGGYYAGVKDGENATSTVYNVRRWDANVIELYGKSVAPMPGSAFPVTGVFTGKIAQGGGNVSDPKVKWRIGPQTGTRSYKLTWNNHVDEEVLSKSPRSDPSRPADSPGSYIPVDARSSPHAASAPTLSLPTTVHFCDVNCVTLHRQGNEYVSESGNDHWTIENFTSQYARFHRVVNNPSFQINYEGRVSDDGSSLVEVANPFWGQEHQPRYIRLTWDFPRANEQELAASLPRAAAMYFCDMNCFTLRWQGDEYVSANGNEHWIVESFTRESATFHRRVFDPAFELTYQGRVSDDGNSLAGVHNPFCCSGGQPENILLTWDSDKVQMLRERQQQEIDPLIGIFLALAWISTFDSSPHVSHPSPPPLPVRAPAFVERRKNPR